MSEIPRLDIHLHRSESGAVVDVRGELDMFTAPRLTDQVAAAFELADAVVLDLSRLDFVDSSGIRALVSVRRWASREGHALEVREPQGAPRRAMELADVLRLLQ